MAASVVSCLYPLALAHGAHVRTVEGLAAEDGALNPLQEAILDARRRAVRHLARRAC